MNKIKVIYDVVRKMKDKDSIKGTVKVEGLKDQEKIIELDSVFERNGQGCQVKGKSTIAVDCDGKKMKLENSIDFQKEGSCGHHGFHHGVHGVGIKDSCSKIVAALGILSSIKIDEKEDGGAILSLEAANIPEEVKSDIHEMIKNCHEDQKQTCCNHQHHMCMKDFHSMENTNFTLKVFINKGREIDKVIIDVNGEQKDEKGEKHQMKLAAELSF